LVDMRDVPFMDSCGLGALAGAMKQLRQAGGQLAVVSPHPTVERLLEFTRMDAVLRVYASQEEALNGMAARRRPSAGTGEERADPAIL